MITLEKNQELIYKDLLRVISDKELLQAAGPNMFKGAWGALFYMFYYEQYVDDTQDNAIPFMEELYNELQAGPGSNFTYCNGLTGPFWLLHHLHKYEFLELDIEDLASDFIRAAIMESDYHLSQNNFDFLHGSGGICNFLVAFSHRPDVKAHLEKFVNALSATCLQTPQGLSMPIFYYHTDPPSPVGTDAFSLAHGTCSMQIILAKIHKAGIAQKTCAELVYGSMEFILNHENKIEGPLDPLYPASLGESRYSRISWCYGDINVAIALWYCGEEFKEERWRTKALNILTHNTKRNTRESAGIVDACLCHGAAGNAAMYLRFWHATNDKAFYQCAEDWYELANQLIGFSEKPSEYGIKVWQGKDDKWQYRWDFLDGAAGTGLSLISRHVDEPLHWDESLLIS